MRACCCRAGVIEPAWQQSSRGRIPHRCAEGRVTWAQSRKYPGGATIRARQSFHYFDHLGPREDNMSYKLLSYHAGREVRAGILVGDYVYDAARVGTDTSYATMDGVLRNWKKAHSSFVAGTKAIEAGKSRAKGIALKKI